MPDLILRAPTEADIDALADLHFYMWNEFYTFVPKAFNELHYTRPQCVDVQKEMLEGCRTAPHEHYPLLAETADGALAGIGYISRNIPYGYDLDVAGTDMELQRMYIRPGHRQNGLGTLMLGHAAAWARQQGYRSAHVWSFDDNAYGRFYSKHQGKPIKHYRRDYTGTPLDLTVYAWEDFAARF